jgi:hypothetical protein
MIRTKIALIGVMAIMGLAAVAYADDVPVIDLIPVKTETVPATPDPRPVMIVNHSLNDRDVEKMARLLWSSPLRSEEEKKNLVWVVMNRAAYGDPFGSSIQDCINVHEFSFFDSHAHRSEENLRIARESMNEWLSRADGYNPGVVIPRCAFYIRFTGENNRHMELLDIHKDRLG